jgi:hypothetical protein
MGIPARRTRRALVGVLLAAWVALPGCGRSPTAPSRHDLTGTWNGTTTYPNSPFRLVLTQSGVGALRGEYTDQLDRSLSVTGTFTDPTFAIVVDFGDAKLNLEGRLLTVRLAEGTMYTSALGNQRFPFTMTR